MRSVGGARRQETCVFLDDSLGYVVQADDQSFLHAGDDRTEAEIKGFIRRWVFDAYSWTPLEVEDRLRAALRLVETKAQSAVKAALGLAEPKRLVENGTSGWVHEGEDSGKEAQVEITRSKILEVMVGFYRYLVDRHSDGIRPRFPAHAPERGAPKPRQS